MNFRFWLQYYYGAWDLEKLQSEFDPTQKNNIIYGYYGAMDL